MEPAVVPAGNAVRRTSPFDAAAAPEPKRSRWKERLPSFPYCATRPRRALSIGPNAFATITNPSVAAALGQVLCSSLVRTTVVVGCEKRIQVVLLNEHMLGVLNDGSGRYFLSDRDIAGVGDSCDTTRSGQRPCQTSGVGVTRPRCLGSIEAPQHGASRLGRRCP